VPVLLVYPNMPKP